MYRPADRVCTESGAEPAAYIPGVPLVIGYEIRSANGVEQQAPRKTHMEFFSVKTGCQLSPAHLRPVLPVPPQHERKEGLYQVLALVAIQNGGGGLAQAAAGRKIHTFELYEQGDPAVYDIQAFL